MAQRNRRPLVIGILAMLVVLALVGGWYLMSRGGDTAGEPVVSPSPQQTSAAPSPASSTSASPVGEQCAPLGDGFVPTEFEMPDSDVVSTVLSLGRDENDAAAAPPLDASHDTGWFNEGPMAGSTHGKVLLTIHTYRNGGALGNEMYEDGPKKVEVGDRMLLRDEHGKIACYEVSAIEKIWVADYDPESTAVYDNDGDPQVAVVICWDFNRGTEEWDSRIVYYADPVTEGPSGSKHSPSANGSTPPPNAPAN